MTLDKLLHLLIGALIAAYLIPISAPLAALAVLAAAFGKEFYDWLTHGRPDAYDAIATIAGGAVSMGYFALL